MKGEKLLMKNGEKDFKHSSSNNFIMQFVCLFVTPTEEAGEPSIYCLGLSQSVSGLLQRARRVFTSLATSTRLWLRVALVLVLGGIALWFNRGMGPTF